MSDPFDYATSRPNPEKEFPYQQHSDLPSEQVPQQPEANRPDMGNPTSIPLNNATRTPEEEEE